jgi:sporulation protein YlmC with PRC-barrel domain
MMLLSIGATIRCRDGVAGKLKYVVVDPEDGEVTHLIVSRGKLLRRDIVVPVSWVEREPAGEIVLNATAKELNDLPEYKELNFIRPDPSYRPLSGHRVDDTRFWASPYDRLNGSPWVLRHVRLGIQENEVVLKRGLPAYARDGRVVGTIDHLVVERGDHRLTHLVVRRGPPWDQQMHIIPMGQVKEVTESGVRLNILAEQLEEAPQYQPPATDQQITFALQRALETDPRTNTSGLRVEVENGLVNFIGNMTDSVREAARSIARRMRGVIGLTDDMAEPARDTSADK